ncbi:MULTISPECIES: DUF354 domain-containing protein [Halorussus]|uniref:DUF354 domain-containing protein n=1 Tax=Halorussus TaxID=1070314 RepID=UPI00209D8B48|nr:DUF354 domain-containing protein [Halorussus vallis]USZ78227.1 DUF354 domain-containing protein [Halorussus vallis]
MKYLFFTNTPAQVHQYRHAVAALEERGHEVLVLARDYGCTKALLDYHELPYELYGRVETKKSSLARELPKHYLTIFAKTLRFSPDYIFGIGSFAALAGAVSRTPVVLVDDTALTRLDHTVSLPFINLIVTPHTFGRDLGEKHWEFRGFKECAYLHPDAYESATDIREKLGVADDEQYAILRFNAFGSHHDVGQGGFSPAKRRELVETLSEHATVFVSDEGGDMVVEETSAREFDLHPALLHDALAEADLLVADTQTMVTEAALLGTPAIRSNSFVGDDDMGNFVDLEQAGLVHNLAEFDEVLETADEVLADPEAADRWAERREEYLADKVNLTEVILDVAENVEHPERVESITRRGSKGGGRTLPFGTGTLRSDGGKR